METVAAVLTIRPATLTDVPRVVEMALTFWSTSGYAKAFTANAAVMTDTATRLITYPNATILVAEADGRAIGMIGLMCYPHPFSGELTAGEVVWWIDVPYRGDGVKLWRAAEMWARERGAVLMQMIAPTEGVGRLYERAGYVPVETTWIRRLS